MEYLYSYTEQGICASRAAGLKKYLSVGRLGVRGDIHTQVATLNVNMKLESEPPISPPLTSSVATNIPYLPKK